MFRRKVFGLCLLMMLALLVSAMPVSAQPILRETMPQFCWNAGGAANPAYQWLTQPGYCTRYYVDSSGGLCKQRRLTGDDNRDKWEKPSCVVPGVDIGDVDVPNPYIGDGPGPVQSICFNTNLRVTAPGDAEIDPPGFVWPHVYWHPPVLGGPGGPGRVCIP